MTWVPEHVCTARDEMGEPLPPMAVKCGNCKRAWCERCDPAPSAMCHYCHGRGRTIAPIPPRQARKLF